MSFPSLGTVMLIDDSKVDNFINSKVLELSSKTEDIKVFEDPELALTVLQKEEYLPDIIFLDIYMPSMNGFDFLEAFYSLPSHIKEKCRIILLSSAFDTLELEKLKKYHWLGGCIVKPLTYDAILNL